MTSTASLGKDVIDLLKEKVALLTDQITSLNSKLADSEVENADLKKQVQKLERQLAGLQPDKEEADGLDEEAVNFLRLLAVHTPLKIPEIAQALRISRAKAEYHRDILKAKRLIQHPGFVVTLGDEMYQLSPSGRQFLVEHGFI
jgi:chromosome segregation ATPase